MPFPILFRTTVTTVLHYRADCDVQDAGDDNVCVVQALNRATTTLSAVQN